MSVFTLFKKAKDESKVNNSQYLGAQNKPDEEGTTPTEPTTPAQPEAKQ